MHLYPLWEGSELVSCEAVVDDANGGGGRSAVSAFGDHCDDGAPKDMLSLAERWDGLECNYD